MTEPFLFSCFYANRATFADNPFTYGYNAKILFVFVDMGCN